MIGVTDASNLINETMLQLLQTQYPFQPIGTFACLIERLKGTPRLVEPADLLACLCSQVDSVRDEYRIKRCHVMPFKPKSVSASVSAWSRETLPPFLRKPGPGQSCDWHNCKSHPSIY